MNIPRLLYCALFAIILNHINLTADVIHFDNFPDIEYQSGSTLFTGGSVLSVFATYTSPTQFQSATGYVHDPDPIFSTGKFLEPNNYIRLKADSNGVPAFGQVTFRYHIIDAKATVNLGANAPGPNLLISNDFINFNGMSHNGVTFSVTPANIVNNYATVTATGIITQLNFGGSRIYIDHITYERAVPEPASLTFISLGAFLFLKRY
ncbi:hypothetical protein JD969_07910 [Planctomycetota bacterium]|nr:hypothetical protein JD969_07910 [Planctomycetota bacterium]